MEAVLVTAETAGPPHVQREVEEIGGGGGKVSRSNEGEEQVHFCGGSGFVWSNGIVLTSATWLANILTLRPSGPGSIPSGVEWELKQPNTIFRVMYQVPKNQTHTTDVQPNCAKSTKEQEWYQSGLRVVRGEVESVILLRDVWQCLTRQLHSLGQWKCELQRMPAKGGRRGRRGEERCDEEGGGGGQGGGGRGEVGEGENVPLEHLLLHLSCVVVLRIERMSSNKDINTMKRASYRPRVGDRLVSVGTPFSTYCPEVFHNVTMSGLVCKLIGRNGSVFLTNACHLPHTEGAGLKRSLSGEVIGMVLAPLFSEKGHPTGLSLATTLSSLPPPFATSSLHSSSPSLPLTPQQNQLKRLCKLVVAVETDSTTWGSGILLSSDRVLTCAHVIRSSSTTTSSGSVTVHVPFHSTSHSGSVLVWNQDMDIAIVGLKPGILDKTILEPQQDQIIGHRNHNKPPVYQGRPIYAIGYESPPWGQDVGDLRPLVTEGVVCKEVGWRGGEGVMMVTSAVVCPGMSGGLVASREGHLLGMIVSISEDTNSGHTYHILNYSLSLPWLLQILQPYTETGDSYSIERALRESGRTVKQLWSLGLSSKL